MRPVCEKREQVRGRSDAAASLMFLEAGKARAKKAQCGKQQ